MDSPQHLQASYLCLFLFFFKQEFAPWLTKESQFLVSTFTPVCLLQILLLFFLHLWCSVVLSSSFLFQQGTEMQLCDNPPKRLSQPKLKGPKDEQNWKKGISGIFTIWTKFDQRKKFVPLCESSVLPLVHQTIYLFHSVTHLF